MIKYLHFLFFIFNRIEQLEKDMWEEMCINIYIYVVVITTATLLSMSFDIYRMFIQT